jgi:mannosyltransferase
MSFIILIITGVALRLYHLGYQSLWMDEAYSVWMSRDLHAPWFNQINDSCPPLYYTFLHYWIFFFGKSEFSIRLPSAIFGGLLILAVFVVAKKLYDKTTALYAALLVAISPNHIYYSQEARMYTLLGLLSLISFFSLYLGIKNNKRTHWACYIFSTFSCLYVHNYGVLLLMAELFFSVIILYNKRTSDVFKKFILSQICILLLFLPRIYVLFKQISLGMNPWITIPNFRHLYATFAHFSLLPWYTHIYWRDLFTRIPRLSPMLILIIPALWIFAFLFFFGLYKSFKKNSYFLPIYIIVPITLSFLISQALPISEPGRYDMLVYPAFCLIVAVGIKNVRCAALRFFMIAVIATASFGVLYDYFFIYQKSNDRIIAEFMQPNVGNDDVIVITGLSITTFEYYWKRPFIPKLFKFPEERRDYYSKEYYLFEYSCLYKSSPASFKKMVKNRPKEIVEQELRDGNDIRRHCAYINRQKDKILGEIYPLLTEKNKLWVLCQEKLESDIIFLNALKKDLDIVHTVKFMRGENKCQIDTIYIFKKRK